MITRRIILISFSIDDLSYQKYVSYLVTAEGPCWNAVNAVDIDTATCMRTEDKGASSPCKTAWFKVDSW